MRVLMVNGAGVGKFMDQMPQKVDDIEIKYWELEPGPTGHGTEKSATFECTFILDGETIGLIGIMRHGLPEVSTS
jgi:hypothetical protein